MTKKAVFYCSASDTIAPWFNEVAREAVRSVCAKGYVIASGGTVKGTMNVVCDEAARCGAHVVGILPRFMEPLKHPALSEVVWTDTMSVRKEKMREGACVAIALPGGIGTMDELFETYTLAKMGLYGGKVIALNVNGFYEPFKALLDHFVQAEMLDMRSRELIKFPCSIGEMCEMLD